MFPKDKSAKAIACGKFLQPDGFIGLLGAHELVARVIAKQKPHCDLHRPLQDQCEFNALRPSPKTQFSDKWYERSEGHRCSDFFACR